MMAHIDSVRLILSAHHGKGEEKTVMCLISVRLLWLCRMLLPMRGCGRVCSQRGWCEVQGEEDEIWRPSSPLFLDGVGRSSEGDVRRPSF